MRAATSAFQRTHATRRIKLAGAVKPPQYELTEDDKAAIECSNKYVEQYGLPLEKIRVF